MEPALNLRLKKGEVCLVLLDWLKNQGFIGITEYRPFDRTPNPNKTPKIIIIGAMRALENDANVCLDTHGQELAFLRSVIMDGRWRDAEQFIAPLQSTEGFDYAQVPMPGSSSSSL